MTATYTNVGLTLLATALQTAGANVAISYVGLGTGCGTLASGLTSGVAYTSLTLAAGLPAALGNGQSLTLLDNLGNTQTVTTSSNVFGGATTIPVTSFTASASFAAGTGVMTTPSATDTQLFNESYRVVANTGAAGATAGESLNSAYFDPSTPSGVYLEVGYYGGSNATSGLGTGVLMARDLIYWSHSYNSDSASAQLDTTISLT